MSKGRREGAISRGGCTVNQDAFARLMSITTKTAATCYLEAGYADQGSAESNRQAAKGVLKSSTVQDRIEYYRELVNRKLDVRAERIMAELSAIAFLDPLDVMDVDNRGILTVKSLDQIPQYARHAIESIEQDNKYSETTGESNKIKVKFHSKLQALRLLSEIKDLGSVNKNKQVPKVTLNLNFNGKDQPKEIEGTIVNE